MSDEYRAASATAFLALAETTVDFAARAITRAGENILPLGFEAMWRALTRGAIMDGQTLHACAKRFARWNLLPNTAGLSAHEYDVLKSAAKYSCFFTVDITAVQWA